MKLEKCWDLMHYCVFMHWRILLFLHDSMDAYTTKQGNVHYIYHNVVVTVAIPNWCLTSTTPGECSPNQKGGSRGVWTDWWIYTRTYGPCVRKLCTHPSCLLSSHRRKIDCYDRLWDCMCLYLTSRMRSLTQYFFKYSNHVLLLF